MSLQNSLDSIFVSYIGSFELLGQSEITDLGHMVVPAKQNIVRVQVPVHDPSVVHETQTLSDLFGPVVEIFRRHGITL